MAIDRTFIESRRRRIKGEMEDTPGIVAKLYSKRNFPMIGHNVDVLARSLLLRGMMSYRVDGGMKAALADFAAACELSREFERALKAISDTGSDDRTGYLDIGNFEIPLYTCLLACNWARTRELASLMAHPSVKQREDPVKAVMTRLLAALILDDKERFRALRADYDRLKKNYWWQQLAHYVDLYDSVLNRDQRRFDQLMDEAERKFLSRATDRKFGDLRPEFGGLAENEIVLDFMGLGIAKLALKGGMRLSKDTEIVPRLLAEKG